MGGRRIKHQTSFEERLATEARRLSELAKRLQPGSIEREQMIRRARQAETALHFCGWLSSSGPRAPE
jgi:hypothetical protein